jgi:hypothetical protein
MASPRGTRLVLLTVAQARVRPRTEEEPHRPLMVSAIFIFVNCVCVCGGGGAEKGNCIDQRAFCTHFLHVFSLAIFYLD